MKNITRRQAAAIVFGSAVAGGIFAGSAKAGPQAEPDWLQVAVDSKRATANTLAKFEIQMSVEPAFQFKA